MPKCIQVPICHQANHTHGIPAIENGYSLSFAHVFTSQCFESTQRLTSFTLIYRFLYVNICHLLVSSVTLIVASSFHRYHRCHLTWSICPDAEAMKSALVFRSHFFWAPRHMSSLDIWLVWHFRLIVLAICWDRSSSCTLEDLTLNMQESWRLFEDRCEESRTSLYQKVVLPNEVPQ